MNSFATKAKARKMCCEINKLDFKFFWVVLLNGLLSGWTPKFKAESFLPRIYFCIVLSEAVHSGGFFLAHDTSA